MAKRPRDKLGPFSEKGWDNLKKSVEDIYHKVGKADEKVKADLMDLSGEFKAYKAEQEAKAKKQQAAEKKKYVPGPQDLKVHNFVTFGFATVNPSQIWKSRFMVKGYEFYGSMNEGFTPEGGPWLKTGTHTGGDGNLFLEDADSWIWDRRLIGRKLEKVYTPVEGRATAGTAGATLMASGASFTSAMVGRKIVNRTRDVEGTISAYTSPTQVTTSTMRNKWWTSETAGWEVGNKYTILSKTKTITSCRKYKLGALGLTWDDGDHYRIRRYPSNRLFSVGSLAYFTKFLGTYYVRCRSKGWGNSYSGFTGEVEPGEYEATLDTPTVVMPKCKTHTDTEVTFTDDGRPYCAECGCVLAWSQVYDGTMETGYYSYFGVDWCNVEVWVDIDEVTDDEKGKIIVDVIRTTTE